MKIQPTLRTFALAVTACMLVIVSATAVITGQLLPASGLNAPIITGPISGTPEGTSVAWTSVPGATEFTLWITDMSDGLNTVVYKEKLTSPVIADMLNPRIALPNVLKHGRVYKIWVNAGKKSSTTGMVTLSPWSKHHVYAVGVGTDGATFNGTVATFVPTMVKPTDILVSLRPLIEWQPIANIGAYQLYIKNMYTNKIEQILTLPGTQNTYTPSYDFVVGNRYAVWIRGLAKSDATTWSMEKSFSISNVPETNFVNQIRLNQQETPVTYVSNQKNVTLLTFAARGSVPLSRMTFTAGIGSLENATNYSLLVDTNNDDKVDTVLKSGVTPQNNAIEFYNLSGAWYRLMQDKYTTFEVRADIVSSPVSAQLQLQLPLTAINIVKNTDSLLSIHVQAISGTDTAVRNEKNITLNRFSARAGNTKDILFTAIGFTSAAGSLNNANNYTLWFDSDNDGKTDKIVQTGKTAQNNTVTFDSFAGGGILLAKEKNVFFEVHADVASSLTSTVLQVSIPITATVIEAEQADNGSSLTGIKVNGVGAATDEILLTTAGGQTTLFTLAQQGNLYVTKDSTPTRTRQVLGGTISDDVLRLNLRAENEPVKVKDLRFTVTGAPTAVSSLALYLDGATTSFGSATTNACATPAAGLFCFSTNDPKLVIPEGSDVDVVVKAIVKPDTAGGTTGTTFAVALAASNSVAADGYASSNPLAVNDADTIAEGEVFVGTNTAAANATITGNTNNVVMAKIVTISNINPASDNTAVPTGITPAGQFRFTAASNVNGQNGTNKAVIKDIIFNVAAPNVTLAANSFMLYNKADSNVTHACTPSALTGTFTVSCTAITGVNTEIDPGQSLDLVLQVAVASIKSNASLQVSLQDFSRSTDVFGVANSHIRWYDKDATGNVAQYYIESNETVVNSILYKN